MKRIDLHVHSNISDGTLSPSELALYAKEHDLSAIALTDHDTINGIEECLAQGEAIGLTVIPGIEFAADYQGREIHILGYYIDYKSKKLHEKLNTIVESRRQRNIIMLEKLNALGFAVTEADLAAGSPSKTIFTRAHFAAALYNKGYIQTRSEAFEKYIGKDKPAYIPRKRFTPLECIETLHEAGGLAVLAHPYLYGFKPEELENALYELSQFGLDGVETVYSTHTEEDIFVLLNLCLKYKLFPTGGSDFHGGNKPGLDIGVGYGNLQVPYELLGAMQNKLGLNP